MSTMTETQFDFQKMSEATGIAVWKLKIANGIPFSEECKAQTREEAQDAYKYAPVDSEARAVARQKWNDFSMKEVESAQTEEEVMRAHMYALPGSEAQIAALRKLATFYRL